MKITLSILKADVGSIGGHTKPSDRMMDTVRKAADEAIRSGLLIDVFVGHTGDDICMTTSHINGPNNTDVHQFAWNTFLEATDVAREYGLYGVRDRTCWWTHRKITTRSPYCCGTTSGLETTP